jgi:hypothetical protein
MDATKSKYGKGVTPSMLIVRACVAYCLLVNMYGSSILGTGSREETLAYEEAMQPPNSTNFNTGVISKVSKRMEQNLNRNFDGSLGTEALAEHHLSSEDSILLPNETDHLILERLKQSINLLPDGVSPISECPPTTQLRLYTRDSGWILQSLDVNGNGKTVGGDEFYITHWDYGDPEFGNTLSDPTTVAVVDDLENGSYRLDWVVPLMSINQTTKSSFESRDVGRLTVHFQYTCGTGKMERPNKANWENGGMLQQVFHTEDVPIPKTIRHPVIESVDLSHYKRVICFGDSIMGNFCGRWWDKVLFQKPNIHFRGNLGSELSIGTLSSIMEKLETWHGDMLKNSSHPSETALLLGSAVWDILEPTQQDTHDPGVVGHIEACRQFVAKVQQEYPNVKIIWKLPQALHVQVLYPTCQKVSLMRTDLVE